MRIDDTIKTGKYIAKANPFNRPYEQMSRFMSKSLQNWL